MTDPRGHANDGSLADIASSRTLIATGKPFGFMRGWLGATPSLLVSGKYNINARLFQFGHSRVLVVKPHWRAYGHLCIEVKMALSVAKQEQAAIHLLTAKDCVNLAYYHLQCDEVPAFSASRSTATLLRALWTLTLLRERLNPKVLLAMAKVFIKRRLKTVLNSDRKKYLPPPALDVLQRLSRGTKSWRKVFVADVPYYRRLLVKEPIPVRLAAPFLEEAERQASQLGIDPTTRIVTVHAREPGYKFGREVHEVKKTTRDDSQRNCRVETYFEAIDWLVQLGYVVVRVGDPAMAPVIRRGVVDLATSPLRTDLLETHLLMRSDFLVASDSGPANSTLLTGKPCLITNATEPICSYPVTSNTLYILKGVRHLRTGQMLSLADLLTRDYMLNLRNTERYEYIDNTPEEILAGVRELVELATTGLKQTRAQKVYRKMAIMLASKLQDFQYVRKWGPDQGFLGDGRICAFYVERYLNDGLLDQQPSAAAARS